MYRTASATLVVGSLDAKFETMIALLFKEKGKKREKKKKKGSDDPED